MEIFISLSATDNEDAKKQISLMEKDGWILRLGSFRLGFGEGCHVKYFSMSKIFENKVKKLKVC